MATKYIYYKVIQGNYGYGWEDEDWHESDSTGFIKTKAARDVFKENLRAYRESGSGGVYRVVRKKELRNQSNPKKKATKRGSKFSYQLQKAGKNKWRLGDYWIFYIPSEGDKPYALAIRQDNRQVTFYFASLKEAKEKALWSIKHWHIKQPGKMPVKKSKKPVVRRMRK